MKSGQEGRGTWDVVRESWVVVRESWVVGRDSRIVGAGAIYAQFSRMSPGTR